MFNFSQSSRHGTQKPVFRTKNGGLKWTFQAVKIFLNQNEFFFNSKMIPTPKCDQGWKSKSIKLFLIPIKCEMNPFIMICNSLLMDVVLPWCNLETIREYLKVLELVPFKYLECRRVKINLIKKNLLLDHFDLDPNKSLNISHTSRLEFKH